VSWRSISYILLRVMNEFLRVPSASSIQFKEPEHGCVEYR
jgi:hypothetical protein